VNEEIENKKVIFITECSFQLKTDAKNTAQNRE